jgi:hypothetical protein
MKRKKDLYEETVDYGILLDMGNLNPEGIPFGEAYQAVEVVRNPF